MAREDKLAIKELLMSLALSMCEYPDLEWFGREMKMVCRSS
jgi:hypothetical protein